MSNLSPGLFPNVIHRILYYLYLLCVQTEDLERHYCSLKKPCTIARQAFSPLLSLRAVSSYWNDSILAICPSKECAFFSRVEDAYYPHPWHINSKVRMSVLFNRYRVYHTISTELGDRGVYYAHDFGSRSGCAESQKVVIKAWVSASDRECISESTAYSTFRSMSGIPAVLENSYEADCQVYAIVLQKLGPTLEELMSALPDARFDEKMVLGVAIQLLNRYEDIHARGTIHNGIKPGNICLPLADQQDIYNSISRSMLYIIDFGFSIPYEISPGAILPGGRRLGTIGNRRFLSIFGHHGISQSQRDDLESLAYLLSYLYHGFLPWDSLHLLSTQYPQSSQDHKPQIWRVKMSTPASTLFQTMDKSFTEFWKDIRCLAFGEVPNYSRMKRRFQDCWGIKNYGGRPGELDWWGIYNRATEEKFSG